MDMTRASHQRTVMRRVLVSGNFPAGLTAKIMLIEAQRGNSKRIGGGTHRLLHPSGGKSGLPLRPTHQKGTGHAGIHTRIHLGGN